MYEFVNDFEFLAMLYWLMFITSKGRREQKHTFLILLARRNFDPSTRNAEPS